MKKISLKLVILAMAVVLLLSGCVTSNSTANTSTETTEKTEQAEIIEATETPTDAPTEEPTPEPTEVPTPEPTKEPTPVPTEEPTPEPTEEPTPVPTEKPTPAPTEAPSKEFTYRYGIDSISKEDYEGLIDTIVERINNEIDKDELAIDGPEMIVTSIEYVVTSGDIFVDDVSDEDIKLAKIVVEEISNYVSDEKYTGYSVKFYIDIFKNAELGKK